MTAAPMRPAPPVDAPWIESPFFERELAARRDRLTDAQADAARALHETGYVALHGAVPIDLCDRIVAETTPMLHEERAVQQRRVQDAWSRGAESVRTLASLPAIVDLLAALFERDPIPFQTLNFEYGTQQRAHADAIHFSSIPARFMCGVWVALEDVDAGNGPLFYYPGSHRLAELTMYDLGQTYDDVHYDRYEEFQEALMEEVGLQPIEFHARKGDALIWSSNIVHGGRPITEQGRTRRSQVTHYFFRDCIYYTPVFSNIPLGELVLKDIIDIRDLQPVRHSYNGRTLHWRPVPGTGLSRISFTPEDDAGGLRTEVERLRSEVAAVRASSSYRLGHSLLEPARRLRQRVSNRGR
jgi:Phytanoyl-CoA dioxygenase (PhyH)